jgi:hypothetical protein
VGLGVLLLAGQARGQRRLWALAVAGVVLSLGQYGPLGLLPGCWSSPFRGPQKLFFLTHAAVALLAGFGLERCIGSGGRRGRRLLLLLPGMALIALVVGLRTHPEAIRHAAVQVVPPLADPRGLVAARELWPGTWLPAGVLALGAGLALARGGVWARPAAALAVLDLLIANGAVNPLAPSAFYDLRPDVAALVRPVTTEGTFRWFSYGVAYTPGLAFEPVMSRAASDVWLYYLDRQSLLPSTPALDGLPAAFGVDPTGWGPEGATLRVEEMTPERFPDHERRLRLANVRWVLSFRRLPEDLAAVRGEVKLPEVRSPLALHELRSFLPRAFWVPHADVDPDPARRRARLEDPVFDPRSVVLLSEMPPPVAAAESSSTRAGGPVRVDYEQVDAHTIRVSASTPPGFLVVLDGFHPDWRAEGQSGPVPLQQADGRYRALPTPGGERVFTLRYEPRWRGAALALAGLAAAACLGLAARRSAFVSDFTLGRHRPC